MRRQDGSISTEVVLLTPVLLVLMGFVVMAGRVVEADGAVSNAAHQAARAASLRDTPDAAVADAEAVARVNLASVGLSCAGLAVVVDTTRLARGGDVTVTVTCTADLSDLAFAGLPGSRTLTATAIEIIDTYRGGT